MSGQAERCVAIEDNRRYLFSSCARGKVGSLVSRPTFDRKVVVLRDDFFEFELLLEFGEEGIALNGAVDARE